MTTSPFLLSGKCAIVTGATGLLGEQHCHALAEAGANVVVTDIDGTRCDRLAGVLRMAYGVEATGWPADVTEKASLEMLRDQMLRRFGRFDILVNNAALNDKVEGTGADSLEHSRFESYPIDLWQESLNVNVTGLFLCSQVLGTPMASHGGGSIINIASTYGIVAPDQRLYAGPDGTQRFYKSPAYPTTKGAVLAFTRFLAAYWGHRGVRVNALSPGGVENSQDEYFIEQYAARTPLGRMGTPVDYKGAVVFLASDASSYMTGANLIVDGGWTIW